MKNNMKGFTLVELLAVIVILAIIALITVPIILNTIEESRQGAAKDSAWGAIEAVKLAYAQAQTDSDFDSSDLSVEFPNDLKIGGRTVTISGDNPTEGIITVDTTNGQVNCKDLKFGKYYCTSSNGTSMECSTSKSE